MPTCLALDFFDPHLWAAIALLVILLGYLVGGVWLLVAGIRRRRWYLIVLGLFWLAFLVIALLPA
jgi:hypothetical protein